MSENNKKDVIYRKPKIERVFKKTIESVMPVSQAMREVGYSEAYASISTRLTKTKVWQKLVEKHLSEKKLTEKHAEALEATKAISAQVFPDGKDGKPINDFIEVPDYAIRLKAVELGYKLRGKLSNNDDNGNADNRQVNFNFNGIDRAGLIELVRRGIAEVGKPDTRTPEADSD